MAEAQARAARLRRLPAPRLDRPELHAHHDERRAADYIELVTRYVYGDARGLALRRPSRWERRLVLDHLDQLEAEIPKHKWGHAKRIDDVRRLLSIT